MAGARDSYDTTAGHPGWTAAPKVARGGASNRFHATQAGSGIKKGKQLPFFIYRTGLAAGIDLNQRLVVLLWQRLAFARNTDRCDGVGGGFLSGAQLGGIGTGQRQPGGTEHGLQIDRCRWRDRCRSDWRNGNRGRGGVDDWRWRDWRRCRSDRRWSCFGDGFDRCFGMDQRRGRRHDFSDDRLGSHRGGFSHRRGHDGRCWCCWRYRVDDCGNRRGFGHDGFGHDSLGNRRCFDRHRSGDFHRWGRSGLGRCGLRCDSFVGGCRCDGEAGHRCCRWFALFVAGRAFDAVHAFAFARFTVATIAVATATTTTTARFFAIGRFVFFAFRTGAGDRFQDGRGGVNGRAVGYHRLGGDRRQCQLFHFSFRHDSLVGTRWTRCALGTLGALRTLGAFRAFAAFAWRLAFDNLVFARFTRLAWRTRWAARTACGIGRFGGLVLRRTRGARFAVALAAARLAVTAAAARATGVAVATVAGGGGLGHDGRCHGSAHGDFLFRHDHAHQLGPEAFRCRRDYGDGRGLDRFGRLALDQRCRLVRRDGLDHGFLARLGFFFLTLAVGHVGFGRFSQRVAGLAVFEARIVVLDAFELVVRRVQMLVRDQDHGNAVAVFDLQHFAALFVQQESGDVDRHLDVDGGRVFLHRLFLDDAQDLQGRRFGVADVAGAGAARAGHMRAFGQRRTQALARQFHQAEAGNLAHLHAGAVVVQRVLQALLDFALVLGHFHVDEVDHDQAAQVAQAQLAGHFLGRFAVGVEGGGLDVGAAGGARRVDVDGNERFGVVDDDGAARRQRHGARVGRFDLVFNLETREQRHIVAVALHAVHHVGHHVAHELVRLFVDIVGIDQDLADIGLEVVADRADHQRRFLVDQEGARGRFAGAFDGAPQLHQVIQVPLQLVDVAADAGGAGDHRHAWRQVQLVHGFAQFLALFTFDAAGHPTTARVVRHQDQIAAGQRNEGGQGGALVAALFLFDLDHDFLAFAQRFLDGGGAHVDAFAEVGAGHFLERQETVAIFAIADEAGFQRRLDAGDHALVDIRLALFASGRLDVDIDQFLTVDDGYAQLFLLRSIKQHAFHFYKLRDPRAISMLLIY